MRDLVSARQGRPEPLRFHLGAAALSYHQAILAAPKAGDAAFPWHPALPTRPRKAPPQLAVAHEAVVRLQAMLDGITRWQGHGARRDMAEPDVLWQSGSTRLLDFGGGADAPAVVMVPSLINRAYILDLDTRRSLARYLAGAGLRPLLLDWGHPGVAERDFTLDHYVRDRLEPAIAAVTAATKRRPALLGYCMGGTLAAGFAARRGDAISRLVSMGAPWDFATGHGAAANMRQAARAHGDAQIEAMLHQIGATFGVIPDAMFQLLFAMLDPLQAARKFRQFADAPAAKAREFVLLENWLNEGVAMAAPAARDLLVDWQLRNTPAKGTWQLLGDRVRLQDIRLPALLVCAKRDIIAPPDTTLPLARAIKGAQVLTPDLGHVGMLVGSGARKSLWADVAAFLKAT